MSNIKKNYQSINNRLEKIIPIVKNKQVLDLGCADHSYDQKENEPNWLHGIISHYATEVIGIDIEDDAIQKMRSHGFTVIKSDVESFHLDKLFDVVVAGDVFEHLSNPGNTIKNIYNHLKNNGFFIITTPNPFSVSQFFKIVKRNSIKVRADHTCWYDPVTIKTLLNLNGFDTVDIFLIKPKRMLHNVLSSYRNYFCPSFIAIAQKN
ncbi:class I SAM-dependent methyltransferase [Chlamydiota bacterium]